MKKDEIRVGGLYTARVSGRYVTVRVDTIRECGGYDQAVYDVTNLTTGRKATFRSAAKFRSGVVPGNGPQPLSYHGEEADPLRPESEVEASAELEGEQRSDPTPALTAEVQPADTNQQLGTATLATPTAGVANIANLITAARKGRAAGSPVAGMVPNAEQESILDAATADGLKVLVIGAGAGTGKTATLKMLEQVLQGTGQYTAFNASLVAESKTKFVKASCNTTHSLAFREVGKRYAHRLNSERVKSYQIARTLGIDALTLTLKGMGSPDPDTGKPTDKLKVLQPGFLAGQVIVAIRRFCQSADPRITSAHLKYIDGIESTTGTKGENNDKVRAYLLPFCEIAWADMVDTNGTLPFSHDVYVKIWQLGTGKDRPVIAADYILLDEYQDTAPVFVSILQQQTQALIILVGDDNQRIYEWRGAINAGDEFPDAERRLLGQSYRFGQIIADVANAVLATLDDPTDLVMRGNPSISSRVDTVAAPRCYLYRTNAGAISRVMTCVAASQRPALIGGKTYVEDMVRWMQAAIDLQAKRGTTHPELSCFESWAEVVEYSKTDEGDDLRLLVKLVDEFGAQKIRDALRDMPKEEDADCVISTAHKSKGREWESVKLGGDFPTINKMGDSDRRLLYVAATRAKLVLDISECPPFCGAQEGRNEGDLACNGRAVPGLEIAYTVPMPTTAEVVQVVQSLAAAAIPAALPTTAPANGTSNGKTGEDEYTWANMSDGWRVRGPRDASGKRVTVTRRNGSTSQVLLGKVTHKLGDLWFYEVG